MLYRKFLMKWFCKIDKGSLGADGCLRWLVKKFWSTFTVKIFTNGARSAVDGVSLLRFSPQNLVFLMHNSPSHVTITSYWAKLWASYPFLPNAAQLSFHWHNLYRKRKDMHLLKGPDKGHVINQRKHIERRNWNPAYGRIGTRDKWIMKFTRRDPDPPFR